MRDMSRVIDIHTHVFPDNLAARAIGAVSGGHHHHFYDGTVEGLLEVMARSGVDVSVTQPVATRPSQVRSINDWAASTANEHIVAFGAMHPDLPDPRAEIERMVSLGLRGFKMHPDYQECAPDDARMRPLLDAAEEFGLIAFMHAGHDAGLSTALGQPADFARMLDAHPGLTVVLAHMGGYLCWDGVRDLLAGRNVWLDTAYTLGHLPDEEFVALARAHGTDRVLFGSDGPWTDPARELAHLRSLGFSADELDAIEHANAERLLGL
jgi:predicted TIM-barrel fold metal-dependent hydrolase